MLDRRFKHLAGHQIDGRILLPAMSYLLKIWEYESERQGLDYGRTRARFWGVKYHRPTILRSEGDVKLQLLVVAPRFHVSDPNGTEYVTGCIQVWPAHGPQPDSTPLAGKMTQASPMEQLTLEREDVYKLLRLRGYDYGVSFQGIERVTGDGRQAEIKWTGKWDSFADSMLHAAMIAHPGHQLALPVGIDHLESNYWELINWVNENGIFVPSIYDVACGTFTAPGLHIKGIHLATAPRKIRETPTLEECSFYPFIENNAISPKLRSLVEGYIEKLGQAMALRDDDIVGLQELESYAEKQGSSAILLKILVEVKRDVSKSDEANVTKEFADRLLDGFNATKAALKDDLIESTVSNERIIRQLIDCIIENNMRQPMAIHEFTLSTVPMHSHFIDSFVANVDHMGGRTSLSYTVHHPNPDEMAPIKNEWNEPKIQNWSQYPSVLSIQKVSKLKTEAKEAPSTEIHDELQGCQENSIDVAIFRVTSIEALVHLAKSEWSMTTLLESIAKGLKTGGFALLILKERLLEHELPFIGTIFMGKGEKPPKNENWTAFTNVNLWIEVAKGCGLEIVAQKSDSITNCCLLLRKIDVPKPPVVFEVSESYFEKSAQEAKDYDWVEQLKECLESIKNSGQKLWLVSRGHQISGVYGLFAGLRREYGAQTIHCLIDMRSSDLTRCLNNEGGAPKNAQELFQEDSLYRDVVAKDLSIGIIDENGQLGAYFYSKHIGPDQIQAVSMTFESL